MFSRNRTKKDMNSASCAPATLSTVLVTFTRPQKLIKMSFCCIQADVMYNQDITSQVSSWPHAMLL